MISKIEDRHRQKPAYIYIRQSSMGQVRHHRESTERQYALKNKAVELGWNPSTIRLLDRDLGKSGARFSAREDFKTLVTDVSMGQVGALFSLEASRLARSCLDWQRLIELCALTGTLVIDEDGCYDPADFNDGLLLGLKGTIAQAELHFIRVRLQGGKRNKANKGELRYPLPVGFCYDDESRIVFDPDQQVQGAVRMVFTIFRQTGSAYGVMREFSRQGLLFPKRAYGGVWDGKLIWGQLSHGRVLGLLKNPSYAGAYVFGRYRSIKKISPKGEVCSRVQAMPMNEWLVNIKDHHEAYITWKEFLKNQQRLENNRTNGAETLLSGPAREGLALLQGLLICAGCGRRLTIRYKGNGGIYPLYECNWKKREGLSQYSCISVRTDLLDKAIAKRILDVIQPAQIEMAFKAMKELENREAAVSRQWQMRIQRAEYEAQLAERRYLEVDPSNRLVADTLEHRWNDALLKLEALKQQYKEFQSRELHVATPQQKAQILALAKDFPRIWNAPTTEAKDKKRMLRLLIKDIAVEKTVNRKQVVLHLRWQGGACEDLRLDLPPKIQDRLRYPQELIERVRLLTQTLSDPQIADALNREGRLSATGKPFTEPMIKWIRYKHKISGAYQQKAPDELTVKQVAESFGVSTHVVYYWIERGILKARRLNKRAPYWITIDSEKEKRLLQWIQNSSRIKNDENEKPQK
jgi:DNA invertase Pin-like site-specific DNA recombinase